MLNNAKSTFFTNTQEIILVIYKTLVFLYL
jgi:hypothetical protein